MQTFCVMGSRWVASQMGTQTSTVKPAKGASAAKARPVCIHLAATPKAESGGSAAASATEKSDTVRRIRLASSWQGVAGAVLESGASGGEVAFALYRVGCLACLMSAQQRAALEASGLVGRLGRLVLAQLPHLCARDVTLALDAFARLGAKPCGQGLRPPRGLLAGLGARAARLAGELEAAQLPLVLWALGALRAEVAMGPLSAAVTRHAPDLSAQGVSLVLWAYCALRQHPGALAVRALGAAVAAQHARMTSSELARALAALDTLGLTLPPAVLAAIAERACVPCVAAAAETHLVNEPRGEADGGAGCPVPCPSGAAWAAAAAHAPAAEDVVGLVPLRAGARGSLGNPTDPNRTGGRWLLAAARPPLQLKFAA